MSHTCTTSPLRLTIPCLHMCTAVSVEIPILSAWTVTQAPSTFPTCLCRFWANTQSRSLSSLSLCSMVRESLPHGQAEPTARRVEKKMKVEILVILQLRIADWGDCASCARCFYTASNFHSHCSRSILPWSGWLPMTSTFILLGKYVIMWVCSWVFQASHFDLAAVFLGRSIMRFTQVSCFWCHVRHHCILPIWRGNYLQNYF